MFSIIFCVFATPNEIQAQQSQLHQNTIKYRQRALKFSTFQLFSQRDYHLYIIWIKKQEIKLLLKDEQMR